MDAPGLEISLNLWNMENKTRGIDLEWSWSPRKLKKGSYKGLKVKTKIDHFLNFAQKLVEK